MNEPPGARMCALTGLTIAEYFRDVRVRCVLSIISSASLLVQKYLPLGRMSSAVGLPTNTCYGNGSIARTYHINQEGICNLYPGYLCASGCILTLRQQQPSLTWIQQTNLERKLVQLGIYPRWPTEVSSSRAFGTWDRWWGALCSCCWGQTCPSTLELQDTTAILEYDRILWWRKDFGCRQLIVS